MDALGFSGSQFPPGFRFHPTDQELIIHYMRSKVASTNAMFTSIIADVDIYKFNPWDLPDKAFFGEGEWFYFSPRDRKYPNGARPNRAAGSGYWKATGTDKPILATGGAQCLGVKKALVFYKGRPPKGTKTDWVMHEYRLLDANPSLPQKHKDSMRLDDWVLCRVRKKGSTPTQSEDGPANQSINAERQSGLNNLYGYGDYKPFADIIGSGEEGGESSGFENSNLDFTKSPFSTCVPADQAQQPQLFSSAIGSIKPTFSFGALDEVMFQAPSKRLNDQLSPALSVYADESFPNIF